MNDEEREYRMCKRCVMDTSDPDIVFDENGICNHCTNYENNILMKDSNAKWNELSVMFNEIQMAGKGKEYDCIIMLSGGADSSLVVHTAKEMGLRAVLITLDDGWGIPEVMENIEAIVLKTGYPLVKYNLNQAEINDLYKAYIKANVIDIETPFDQVISYVAIEMAKEWDVNYILTGSNMQTEGIMAKTWAFNKLDRKNLLAIHKKHGTIPLDTYRTYSPWKLYWYKLRGKYKFIKPLCMMKYDRDKAVETLKRDFDWKPYKKNSESLFTRFDKRVILPVKFGVEKIRGNYSAMIMSGLMTRSEAKFNLKYDVDGYKPTELWIEDMKEFCRKLELDTNWFTSEYFFAGQTPHTDYAYHKWLYKLLDVLRWGRNLFRK